MLKLWAGAVVGDALLCAGSLELTSGNVVVVSPLCGLFSMW